MAGDQEHIDGLLQRYLALLDEYTRLRAELGVLQAGVFQGIARANFSAERGARYGRDQYDERMRAACLLRIAREDDAGPPVFSMSDGAAHGGHAEPAKVSAGSEDGKEDEERLDIAAPDGKAVGEEQREDGDENEKEQNGKDRDEDSAVKEPPKAASVGGPSKDPLRWFGLLAPSGLRSAQDQSIQAVRRVIPRLVTVDAEMLAVEIEVRRARKRRAKAAAQEATKREHREAARDDDASGGREGARELVAGTS